MVLKLEYDFLVKRLNAATVAVLALILAGPAALAQARGVPASVTSTGFGGSTGPRGTPASVTSTGFGAQGHHGPAMPARVASPGFQSHRPGFPSQPSHHPQPGHNPHRGDAHHGGNRHQRGLAVYAVPYYYPYSYDTSEYEGNQPVADESANDEYQGGPTIFDRRGPGTSRPAQGTYAQTESAPPAAAKELKEAVAEPVRDQPDTLLVFKDGHQLEISNYAIVGATLFDLSDGQRHKIPLSELNLTATAKENDDRGIDFQLPAGFQAN